MYTIHNNSIQNDTSMKALTRRQRIVLDFLQEYSKEHGFPPTMREIGEGIGLSNVSAVRGHLAALEKKGYISKDADKARSIRVLHSPSVFSRFKRKLHEIARTDKAVIHRIVYGIAVATKGGNPFFTGQANESMINELDKRAVEHGWHFVTKNVEPDHVVVVVEVWPNHSPELVARRIKAAGDSVAGRCRQQLRTSTLWANGYAATTELKHLDEHLELLLEAAKTKVKGPDRTTDREEA